MNLDGEWWRLLPSSYSRIAYKTRWVPNVFQADQSRRLRVWHLGVYVAPTLSQGLSSILSLHHSEMESLIPDLSLRQPLVTPLILLFLTYYALAVLAVLPNTFLLRLSLQPIFLWKAWRCVADVDFAAWLAQFLGLKSAVRLHLFNSTLVVRSLAFFYHGVNVSTLTKILTQMAVSVMVLRSFEWAFIIKEPIRRYKFATNQDDRKTLKKQFSISSVSFDAFDLLFNLRGSGWSWSPKAIPRRSTAPESISSVVATLLFNITVYDTAHYLMQCVFPTIGNPTGGESFFDPNLSLFLRISMAAFAGICGGVWTYSLVETLYRTATLVGRVLFRQPASDWPPVSNRPWLSTSINEYWSIRWHQLFRHVFITFGARPCGALLGRPGAIMGAFAVSAVLHHLCVWGLGNGHEFSTAGGFFLLMGLGAIMEIVFGNVTGMRVQGFAGWLWTMSWTLMWGTLMLDGWARHGMLANVFPDRLRPGKALVDAIIGSPKI